MPNGKAKLKVRIKTMEDEILDRLDHVENTLEDHANAGIRNDNQIMALEEAICPRVAARLTAIERQLGLFKLDAGATATAPLTPPTYGTNTTGLRLAILREFGLEFTPEGALRLLNIVNRHA